MTPPSCITASRPFVTSCQYLEPFWPTVSWESTGLFSMCPFCMLLVRSFLLSVPLEIVKKEFQDCQLCKIDTKIIKKLVFNSIVPGHLQC